MPPAPSDEEASDVEIATYARSEISASVSGDGADVGFAYEPVPRRHNKITQSNGSEDEEEGEEEEEEVVYDDEDLSEDEYVQDWWCQYRVHIPRLTADGASRFIVEAIRNHMIDEDGSLKFQVKWEGYESKKDLTWEPEVNLEESAREILDDYFDSIGGRDSIFEQTEKASRVKKRRRQASNTAASSSSTKRSRRETTQHPAHSAPPASAPTPWTPPAGSWEEEIEAIDACEDQGSGRLVVYLVWKNGKKTKHDTSVIYKKCPQKMLQFYERHVKIITEDT
ncbi:hypothetical protein E4U17_001716 [Claviceps sp. LM77 group G4]|nr:hypothetical protein E4U17_001716 [Claviceps sp. LM77 group G4]KAG6075282.1 hypothetical protein E4U16_003493 [Claviceps sp. LM84 group G4]